MNKIYQVYQVSDSTGETLDRIFLALKAQFSNFECKTIHYSFTRTKNQVDKIIAKSKLDTGLSPIDLLTQESEAFSSRGEVRRLIQSNSISVNKIKINENDVITKSQLLNNKYLLIQKGKKNYIIISVE